MKTLVIGGRGTVGSQVIKELIARNVNVRVLVRSLKKDMHLPKGVEVVTGDILDIAVLNTVFKDIDRVFFLFVGVPQEAGMGLFALNAARKAGVKRIVYLSVQDVEGGVHIPHFGSKLAIEEAIKASGIPYTILRANNFYQNDSLWFKDAMMQYGVYPQPLGDIGLSRVDVRDIGEAAAIALTTDGHTGKTYNLVGPDVLTGEKTAEIWGKALGKPISYAGNDLDAWEQQFLQYLPDWQVYEFKIMYDYFQKKGLKATSDDIERQTKLIGHPPRSFETFAKEWSEKWKSQE